MEKIVLENTNQNTSGVVILISDKMQPKAKHTNRKKKHISEDKEVITP